MSLTPSRMAFPFDRRRSRRVFGRFSELIAGMSAVADVDNVQSMINMMYYISMFYAIM